MPMRDNFLAAKKVAIALHSLISTQYPRDFLGSSGFGEVARTLRPTQLPEVSWDFIFGTNMQHALLLARRMLCPPVGHPPGHDDHRRRAHRPPAARTASRSSPTRRSPETVRATLAEVARCTAESIRINTFMLDVTPHLQAFVERMAKINRGRVFFTTPETLGSYVLVDFLEQKRAPRRASRRAAAPPDRCHGATSGPVRHQSVGAACAESGAIRRCRPVRRTS